MITAWTFNDKTTELLLFKRDYIKLRSIPELTRSNKKWVGKLSLMESIKKKLFYVTH